MMKLVTILAWLAWRLVCWPFRQWKLLAVLLLSAVNILSFLSARSTEFIYIQEFNRLLIVDHAQQYANRALGIAEMERLRAEDLEERLALMMDENETLRGIMEAAGVGGPPNSETP